jgi:hypothetical protein
MANVYIGFSYNSCEYDDTLSSDSLFIRGSWNRSLVEDVQTFVPIVSCGIVSSMLSILTKQMSSFCSKWENGDVEHE